MALHVKADGIGGNCREQPDLHIDRRGASLVADGSVIADAMVHRVDHPVAVREDDPSVEAGHRRGRGRGFQRGIVHMEGLRRRVHTGDAVGHILDRHPGVLQRDKRAVPGLQKAAALGQAVAVQGQHARAGDGHVAAAVDQDRAGLAVGARQGDVSGDRDRHARPVDLDQRAVRSRRIALFDRQGVGLRVEGKAAVPGDVILVERVHEVSVDPDIRILCIENGKITGYGRPVCLIGGAVSNDAALRRLYRAVRQRDAAGKARERRGIRALHFNSRIDELRRCAVLAAQAAVRVKNAHFRVTERQRRAVFHQDAGNVFPSAVERKDPPGEETRRDVRFKYVAGNGHVHVALDHAAAGPKDRGAERPDVPDQDRQPRDVVFDQGHVVADVVRSAVLTHVQRQGVGVRVVAAPEHVQAALIKEAEALDDQVVERGLHRQRGGKRAAVIRRAVHKVHIAVDDAAAVKEHAGGKAAERGGRDRSAVIGAPDVRLRVTEGHGAVVIEANQAAAVQTRARLDRADPQIEILQHQIAVHHVDAVKGSAAVVVQIQHGVFKTLRAPDGQIAVAADGGGEVLVVLQPAHQRGAVGQLDGQAVDGAVDDRLILDDGVYAPGVLRAVVAVEGQGVRVGVEGEAAVAPDVVLVAVCDALAVDDQVIAASFDLDVVPGGELEQAVDSQCAVLLGQVRGIDVLRAVRQRYAAGEAHHRAGFAVSIEDGIGVDKAQAASSAAGAQAAGDVPEGEIFGADGYHVVAAGGLHAAGALPVVVQAAAQEQLAVSAESDVTRVSDDHGVVRMAGILQHGGVVRLDDQRGQMAVDQHVRGSAVGAARDVQGVGADK